MKRYVPFIVIALAAVFISTTGFQCSSAELTSARLYVQQKNWAKAEESCLKELAKNDKNEEAWYILGQVRHEVRNYKGALDAFDKAGALSDAHKADIAKYRLVIWQSAFNDGVRFFNTGKDTSAYYQKALDNFATAIDAQPDSAMTYFVAARAAMALKDNKAADGFLETALKKNPKYGDAASLLGELHYGAGIEKLDAKDEAGANAEFAKATAAFENAYRIAPENPNTITALIEVYERTKNPGKALTITRDAVTKEPNNKLYRYALGVFLLKQAELFSSGGQYDSAGAKYLDGTEQFKKALEIDPAYADANYNCGVAFLNWGVSIKAELDKKNESVKNPQSNPKVEAAYKEKFKLALPYLEKATEVRSDDIALWQQLGRLYALMNDREKSRAAFKKMDDLMKAGK